MSDRLLDMSQEYEQMQLNFHLTSIYDNTLHEAFSRVLQRLTEPLPYLEELMNVFCAVRNILLAGRLSLTGDIEFPIIESLFI